MGRIPEQRVVRDNGTTAIHMEKPSRLLKPCRVTLRDDLGEHWENDVYYGVIRRHESGCPLGGGPWALLSISALSELALHDWRDFQRIKNDLCGAEWEAVELYPSEVRLVDPSNRFYLWCVPPGVIPFGWSGNRRVLDIHETQAPQRPFPRG